MKHLHRLSFALFEMELFKQAGQVFDLPKDRLQGSMPTFDWLMHGKIGSYALINPFVFDEFVDLNSAKLSTFGVIGYIGSGAVGDAFLLDNGNVLKIFDERATVDSISDLEKYETLRDSLYEGSAGTSVPMIYDIGDFERPDSMDETRSPSHFNKRYSFYPHYVVMEKVKDLDSIASRYAEENYNRVLEYIEAESANDDIPKEQLEKLFDPDESAFNFGDYDIPNQDVDDYKGMVEQYFDYGVDELLSSLRIEMDRKIYDLELSDPREMGSEDKAEVVGQAVYEIREMVGRDYFDTLGGYLGLNREWEREVANAAADRIMMGYTDLHSGNFGFRNRQVVFFDS